MNTIQSSFLFTSTLVPMALFLAAFDAQVFAAPTQAENGATGQMKVRDAIEDAKTTTKKSVRAVKRLGRKMIGTDTALKDAKDKVNDLKDDVQNKARKIENRVTN